MGLKQELSHGTAYHAQLVVAPGYETRGSEGPTLLALPIGALHSPAKDLVEVNDPVTFQHAGAPLPVTVPVDPPALAEWATTGFIHRFEKSIPRFLEFLTSFV